MCVGTNCAAWSRSKRVLCWEPIPGFKLVPKLKHCPFRMSAGSNAQDDPRFLSLTNQVLKGCGCGSVSSYILRDNLYHVSSVYIPPAFSLLCSRIIASSASLSLLAALVNWGKRTVRNWCANWLGADSVGMCLVNSIQWMLSLEKKDTEHTAWYCVVA